MPLLLLVLLSLTADCVTPECARRYIVWEGEEKERMWEGRQRECGGRRRRRSKKGCWRICSVCVCMCVEGGEGRRVVGSRREVEEESEKENERKRKVDTKFVRYKRIGKR